MPVGGQSSCRNVHDEPADDEKKRHSNGSVSEKRVRQFTGFDGPFHVKKANKQSRNTPQCLNNLNLWFWRQRD